MCVSTPETTSLEILKLSKEIAFASLEFKTQYNGSKFNPRYIDKLIAEISVSLTKAYKDNLATLKELSIPQFHCDVLGDK